MLFQVAQNLPSSLKELRGGTFSGCSSLTNLTLNDGLEVIGERMFNRTMLESLVIPSSVKTIGENLFVSQTPISSIVFEENHNITTIENNTFKMCEGIEEFDLSSLKNLTTIKDNA